MNQLYISGAQACFAVLDDGKENFYGSVSVELKKLALKHKLEIFVKVCNDGSDIALFLAHKVISFGGFSGGEVVAGELKVAKDDNFKESVSQFLNEMKSDVYFDRLHSLNWTEPDVLIFFS